MTKNSIVSLAVSSELALVILSYGIAFLSGLQLRWNLGFFYTWIGLLAAIPLLVGNALLWRWALLNPSSVYARFSREVVVPLCKQIPPRDALIIGVLSGIGEEALFRGALNNLIVSWLGTSVALILTSLAFACVHFIGNFRRYGGMIPLYTAVGALLWVECAVTGSLAAAAITHGFYNFCAIAWINRTAQSSA
jgi:membrane protease YdiL (CAAX protease family)